MKVPYSSLLNVVKQQVSKVIPAGESQNSEGWSPLGLTLPDDPTAETHETLALSSTELPIRPEGAETGPLPFIGMENPTPILQSADDQGDGQPGPFSHERTMLWADQAGELEFGPGEMPAIAGGDGMSEPEEDSLKIPESAAPTLKELFGKKPATNHSVKALLKRHEPVDTRVLNEELKEFARSLGASTSGE